MEDILIREMNAYLAELKRLQVVRTRRYKEVQHLSDRRLKKNKTLGEHIYYNVIKKGEKKPSYAGTGDSETVRRIQEQRFLRKMLDAIRDDIDLIENFLKNYKSINIDSITNELPLVYQNKHTKAAGSRSNKAREWKQKMEEYKATFPVYKPEELIHETLDGTFVRSKSELAIYNYLFQHGYTFVYELPLNGRTRKFFPDFTILSEIDYKTQVRIEHQGMMSDDEYKESAEVREYDYWYNGYLPNRDVYFTYDDNKGGFDMKPIIYILDSRVRPADIKAAS